MASIILFNKPFLVLSQFTDTEGRPTLKEWFPSKPGFHPAGRLDYDSEGLLLLTDDGALQARISQPRNKIPKTYWVQVEGMIDEAALEQLRQGVLLKDGPTLPAGARSIAPPTLWPREKPITSQRHPQTSWLEIILHEGRNRQVRRMTAAVGFPTLRLVRYRIGEWSLDDLQPGEHRQLTVHLPQAARPILGRNGKRPYNGGPRKQRSS